MIVLGIDIGGTKSIVAAADGDGHIISEAKISTPRDEGPEGVLAVIEFSLRQILHDEGLSHRDVSAVGVGCGGPLDADRGVILTAPNLPGWDNFPIGEVLRRALSAPVYLDNDTNLAGLGEARRGAGGGVEHLAYFNIGTGIGGAILIGGRPYRGCGNAGEFGHQVILPDGPPCLCGRYGCLESLASGTSIARIAWEQLFSRKESAIADIAGTIESITAVHVAEAARRGDPLALEIWRATGEYLGIGVANVVNILNPGRVILGGGVMQAADLLLDTVRHTVKERAMAPLADVEVVPGELGGRAGIIGAIHLALEGS